MELAAGRNFSPAFSTDPNEALIVNETLVRALGWEDPIGQRFEFRGGEKTVIGVAKDFHFKSLHEKITPTIMHIREGWPILHVLVRLSPENIPASLSWLQERWREINPEAPFTFSFLDEDLNEQYRTEQRLSEIVRYSSLLAVLLAGLGLFGLASLVLVRRTKEIGIRKVLGASVPGIIRLVSQQFALLVIFANILAWPLAYFVMNKWLQNFAYRIDVGWWVFALAGGLALLIALLTVSTQAIKAALANPVEALRYE
jgi:putative ABC transport system permease protein